jgi:hypothetical protein
VDVLSSGSFHYSKGGVTRLACAARNFVVTVVIPAQLCCRPAAAAALCAGGVVPRGSYAC